LPLAAGLTLLSHIQHHLVKRAVLRRSGDVITARVVLKTATERVGAGLPALLVVT